MTIDDERCSKTAASVIDFAAEKAKKAAMRSGEINSDGSGHTGPTKFSDAACHTVPSHAHHVGQMGNLSTASDRDARLAPAPSEASRFALFPEGVYEMPEPGAGDPIYICTPLRVDAMFADQSGTGRGRLVSILVDGEWLGIPVKNSAIHCRPSEVVAKLVDEGLEIAPDKKSKDRLMMVLKAWTSDVRLQTVKRMGWVDNSYSSFTIGESLIGHADRLPLAANGMTSGLITRGSADDWRAQVGVLCRDNPLMILAASLAFSGPLLRPLNMEGGGLHFRGESSCGKSTLLKLATSVWGGEQIITQWNATSNGLEAIASTVNDMLLPLDEIGEISAVDLYKATYTLAHGESKGRARSDGSLAERAQWRLALISTGELSLNEKLSESRRAPKSGQEVRLIDVEADRRAYGAFDNLHGAVSGSAFSDMVQAALRHAYGAPGRAFVEHLIGSDDLNNVGLRSNVDRMALGWIAQLPSAPDGQIARVAKFFAMISLAGTLATKFGLTGWEPTDARDAAEQAFRDWYDRRYADKRDAADEFVRPLQDFLKANLDALDDLKARRSVDDATPGWRDETKVYLKRATWQALYPNVDATRAAKALIEMKLLLKGDGKHLLCRAPHAIDGRPRLYTVNVDRLMAYKAG